MARPKFGFRPSMRKTLADNKRAMDFYGLAGDPNYAPEVEQANRLLEFERGTQEMMMKLAKARGPVVNRSAPEDLEAAVLREVAAMLHEHPLVVIAIRQNSGAASYEAKSGKWAPVRFYDWIKRPSKMRVVDVWGFLTSGRFYALECKRREWKGPSDDREREQAAFLECVKACGGVAGFCRSAEEARAIISADPHR